MRNDFFLFALNNGSTFKGETYSLPTEIKNRITGNFAIAYGNNWNTIKHISINTSQTNNSNYLYKDGIPEITPGLNLPVVVYENGDGTVPESSAKFVFDDVLGVSNNQHSSLIKALLPQLFNFINSNSP